MTMAGDDDDGHYPCRPEGDNDDKDGYHDRSARGQRWKRVPGPAQGGQRQQVLDRPVDDGDDDRHPGRRVGNDGKECPGRPKGDGDDGHPGRRESSDDEGDPGWPRDDADNDGYQ